jgi:hypothetical protein
MDKKLNRLLNWLSDKEFLLESQIVASSLNSSLNSALSKGFADMTAHPSVRERGVPAAAVFITDKGRAAITYELWPKQQ